MDIGWGELLIILIVALLVVGPEKLPYYARKTARFVRNIQKVTTNLTGQISKAINLDDEENVKTSDFKKDLIAVKKSLEKDVAELKSSLDGQAKAISETMESGTKDAVASLKKSAREISETMESGTKDATASLKKSAGEISETLNTQAGEIKATLDAQAQTVSKTVETEVRNTTASLEKGDRNVAENNVPAAPLTTEKMEPIPQPSSPPPPVRSSEAEVH
jgi:sec-independent protein translocase protein TatB